MEYGYYALTAMGCLLSVGIIFFRARYSDTSNNSQRVCKKLLSLVLLYTFLDFIWGIVAKYSPSSPAPLSILSLSEEKRNA